MKDKKASWGSIALFTIISAIVVLLLVIVFATWQTLNGDITYNSGIPNIINSNKAVTDTGMIFDSDIVIVQSKLTDESVALLSGVVDFYQSERPKVELKTSIDTLSSQLIFSCKKCDKYAWIQKVGAELAYMNDVCDQNKTLNSSFWLERKEAFSTAIDVGLNDTNVHSRLAIELFNLQSSYAFIEHNQVQACEQIQSLFSNLIEDISTANPSSKF